VGDFYFYTFSHYNLLVTLLVSLIIPIFNEELLIDTLAERCLAAMQRISPDFEIICVDDGSTDRSLSLLKAQHKKDKRIKIITLSRNFGHQAAYTAGLSLAKGSFIAMMDGDLQDPPELLPEMYKKLAESADELDIIYGKRTKRGEELQKALSIRLFHKIFKYISGIDTADNVGNFSMFNRRALEAFLSLEERNRYLPGLRFFIGFKQGYVEYARNDRAAGEAKMTFPKLVRLALDAIFSFSDIPIKICFWTGVTGIMVLFIAGLYALFSKLTGSAYIGWSSLSLSIYFLGSVQLLFLGVIGEYVFRIYRETQRRPIFIIRKVYE
jgi:polyisoprenyl-phosphate glycosyltransferase